MESNPRVLTDPSLCVLIYISCRSVQRAAGAPAVDSSALWQITFSTSGLTWLCCFWQDFTLLFQKG